MHVFLLAVELERLSANVNSYGVNRSIEPTHYVCCILLVYLYHAGRAALILYFV